MFGHCCDVNTLPLDALALLSCANVVFAKVHSCAIAIVGLVAAIVEVEVDTERRWRTSGSDRGLLRIGRGAKTVGAMQAKLGVAAQHSLHLTGLAASIATAPCLRRSQTATVPRQTRPAGELRR